MISLSFSEVQFISKGKQVNSLKLKIQTSSKSTDMFLMNLQEHEDLKQKRLLPTFARRVIETHDTFSKMYEKNVSKQEADVSDTSIPVSSSGI